MNKFFVFAIMAFALGSVASAEVPTDKEIEAMIHKESDGLGGDNAIGDLDLPDHAYGCLQIRQPYVDDYNRIFHTDYRAVDCLGNRQLSIKICKGYIDYYATPKRLGHEPTSADKFGIHNGGPKGWKKTSTQGYRKVVLKILSKLGD